MSVPTVQTAITNVSISTQFAPARGERRALYIRNYVGSTGIMYIAFGQPATAGTNGEMELVAGGEYNWNGLLPPLQGNVPLESINIIVTGGSATGCIVENL